MSSAYIFHLAFISMLDFLLRGLWFDFWDLV